MSRHRAVRNLDLDEEMAEDDIYEDEDPYENITEDERFELEGALAQAQEILGPESQSGFTDRELKDALWEAYFDVDQAVGALMEEKSKREAKEKKKADDPSDESSQTTLTALQRLSLSRKAAGTARDGDAPASPSGAKRAQGIAGLTGGGRAKMAKQGLAKLAPPHLQERALATTTTSPSQPAPKSKLAALAAARKEKNAVPKAPAATEVAKEGPASAKPLSKLQQKMAAAKAAKERAAAIAAGHIDPAEEEEKPLAQPEIVTSTVMPECTVSGHVSSLLFPTVSSAQSISPIRKSAFGSTLCRIGDTMSASSSHLQAVPGGSPFKPVRFGDESLAPFAGPSPDDVKKAEAQRKTAAPVKTNPAVAALRKDVETLSVSSSRASSVAGTPGASGSSSAPSASNSAKGSVASTPKVGISHERILEEYRKKEKEGLPSLSLVVVGHVDAGKSTMMGRLLYELGNVSEREHSQNERASHKAGKGSFAFAWALDSSEEERARGVTIDVAQDNFRTPNRKFVLLDAPGHRDFIPNMISGAAQADAALLVIDAAKGAFEAGFGPNGQTREHALLVRSLGVQQLVVVINKLDALDYDQKRFEEISEKLRPFLAQTGFDNNKTPFVPCGAAVGENLSKRDPKGLLQKWYNGPTLIDVLDKLEPPTRQIDSPLRMPIINVFKGQTAVASGVAASGRVVSGILQIGDRLRVVPGDESGIVKNIEQDGETAPWAVAGASVTVYLSNIDQIHVNIGSVLCPPTAPVQLCNSVLAQVLVFQPTYPLVTGTSVELFHHSANVPASLGELVATIDKGTGEVKKRSPRVLSHGTSAQVRINLHSGGNAGQSSGIPLEAFKENKEMARILLRRDGETVAAGIVMECYT